MDCVVGEKKSLKLVNVFRAACSHVPKGVCKSSLLRCFVALVVGSDRNVDEIHLC